MQNVCVACKAHLGWVNAVAVAMQTSEPAPLLAQRIELVNRGDREAIEP